MTLSETADKIRALMSDDPSQPLNLLRLARAGDKLNGVLDVGSLQRAGTLLSSDKGELSYCLSFDIDESKRILIDIEIAATLEMTCQRCLQPLEVAIERKTSVAAVREKAELNGLANNVEPLILSEQEQISLLGLVEDELILALPLAPLCPEATCDASKDVERIKKEGKPNPFAELAKLKKTNE